MKFPNPNLVGTSGYICDFCATERGGVYFKTGSTACVHTCGYCDGAYQVEKFLFPTVDYLWRSRVETYDDGGRKSAHRIATSRADWGSKMFKEDDFPSHEQQALFRETDVEWKQLYQTEFDRIQKIWGFE